MKRWTLFFFLAPVLFQGCDNDEKVELMWYTDVNPDQSTTTLVPFPWVIATHSQNNIMSAAPTGHNSIVTFATALRGYDMDHDGFYDFDFYLSHNFRDEDESLPDELMISMGSKKDHILSFSDKVKRYIKKYSFGEVLDYDSFENNSDDVSSAYLINKNGIENFDSNGEFYLAVKKIIKNKPHYGWFLVQVESASLTITVKEFTLCRNADQEITIGQTQ